MASDLPRPTAHPRVDGGGAQPTGAPPPGGSPSDSPRSPVSVGETETEPDARFTFANERTFLAWHRTALALVIAGLAIAQFLPPFPGIPIGRHLLAVPLILLGGALSVASYVEWTRHQRALRRGEPMGTSMLPRILAILITILAAVAAVLSLLAPATGD
jgi:putative membrane protein